MSLWPSTVPTRSFFVGPISSLREVRLGIDLDGVVADFNAGWISRYNTEYGAELPSDAVKGWDAIPSLTHFEDMRAFWKWARDHDGHSLFRHLEPYPGAVESLWKLTKARHQVVIITTKPPWAIHDTFAWIAHHQIPTREVHIIEQKWSVDCDIYLDDGPHVLKGLVERRPDRIICRFVRPWNDPVEGATDVDSWPAFLDLVAHSNPLRQG